MLLLVSYGERETRVIKAPDIGISKADYVIYKTEAGKDIGQVIDILPHSHTVSYRFASIARKEDIASLKTILGEETEKLKECKDAISDYGLEMKLVSCHIQFDKKKIKFYFLAETRIDYRLLLKEISKKWNMRVEFQQIGARDYAKTFPEYGICGMKTCCSKFLKCFESVTTPLLRLQNLACGTDKATGICGKLLCCLKYEEEFYREQEKIFPLVGSIVNAMGEEGVVIEKNIISRTILVRYSDGRKIVVSLDEIQALEQGEVEK